MPTIIIKPHPRRDQYVLWSTVTDTPVAHGTRAEILTYLPIPAESRGYLEARRAGTTLYQTAARIARADLYGTSALWGFGGWDDHLLVFDQRGMLPRRHAYRAARLLSQNCDRQLQRLLQPFDDPDRAHRRALPRLSVWPPCWHWHGLSTLLPIGFGGDEHGRRTVVLGWTVTGRIIVAISRPTQ